MICAVEAWIDQPSGPVPDWFQLPGTSVLSQDFSYPAAASNIVHHNSLVYCSFPSKSPCATFHVELPSSREVLFVNSTACGPVIVSTRTGRSVSVSIFSPDKTP